GAEGGCRTHKLTSLAPSNPKNVQLSSGSWHFLGPGTSKHWRQINRVKLLQERTDSSGSPANLPQIGEVVALVNGDLCMLRRRKLLLQIRLPVEDDCEGCRRRTRGRRMVIRKRLPSASKPAVA